MFETTITYNNSDGQFRFDEEIREAMDWWRGEETDSGQDLETHMREITFVFQDEDDAILASGVLEEMLGDCFEELTCTGWPVEQITFTDDPEEPKSPDLAIDFDPDQSRIPRESVSVLTFNQCAGLKHRNTGPDAAKVVFDSFSKRLGWDFEIQADVLLNWCGQDIIEPLLRHIQEAGQTADFEEFLLDNFRVEQSEDDSANAPTGREKRLLTLSDTDRRLPAEVEEIVHCVVGTDEVRIDRRDSERAMPSSSLNVHDATPTVEYMADEAVPSIMDGQVRSDARVRAPCNTP